MKWEGENIIDVLSAFNMIDSAKVTMTAALARKESRGSHYREDYPERNDKDWKRIITVVRDKNGNCVTE